MRTASLLFILVWALVAHSHAPPARQTENYIREYADLAMAHMRSHGIPASIKLAQGILESQSGTSSACLINHAHFGIKAHKSWQGPTFQRFDDDTDKQGNRIPSYFRAYNSAEESYLDHSRYLLENKRYAHLFKLHPADYWAWAWELQRAYYASDPHYAKKLIGLIESYGLFKFDHEVRSEMIFGVEQQPLLSQAQTDETLINWQSKGRDADLPKHEINLQAMFVQPAKIEDAYDWLEESSFNYR